MFSVNFFYEILLRQLILKLNTNTFCYSFKDFGSSNFNDITFINDDFIDLRESRKETEEYRPMVFFYDQEPFYTENFNNFYNCNIYLIS